MHRLSIAVPLTAAALVGTAVQASPVGLEYLGFNYSPPESVFVSLNGEPEDKTIGARAGEFRMRTDGGESFLAYCIDLLDRIADGKYDFFDPDASSEHPGTDIVNNLQGLYTNHYASVDTATESAAFQLAIWEIAYETAKGSFGNIVYSLDSGNFSVLHAPGDVKDFATTYFADLGFTDAGYRLTFWDGPDGTHFDTQDLVSASPVPLPAAGWMLLAGIGGLAAMRSRHKKKAAA